MLDNMLDNIGNTLKKVSKLILLISIVITFSCLIIGVIEYFSQEELTGKFLIINSIRYGLTSIISSLFLYGFGDLVYNVSRIARDVSELKDNKKN